MRTQSNNWTRVEIQAVKRGRAEGKTAAQIGKEIGRTRSAVIGCIYYYRIPNAKRWTKEELRHAILLRLQDKPYKKIAEDLPGRTWKAIKAKMVRYEKEVRSVRKIIPPTA